MFCDAFDLGDLKNDAAFATNTGRVENKDRLLPQIADVLGRYDKTELMKILEHTGLPFAPISKPSDLFDDPHLNAGDGLVPVTLSDGSTAYLPALPIEMNGQRMGVRKDLPGIGNDTKALLKSLGYDEEAIARMKKRGQYRNRP